MLEEVREIIENIRKLRIQGARNVAKACVKALSKTAKHIEAETKEEFVSQITKVAMELMVARPTEPMTRNLMTEIIRFLLFELEKEEDLKKLRRKLTKNVNSIMRAFDENIVRLATIGANYLPEDAEIVTICHSSSVVSLLSYAAKIGKLQKVYVCETRPLYQGRITARELSSKGIDVTIFVDGAMAIFAKRADLAIVGADAITAAGDLINKVGTSTLARIMHVYGKTFFSAAESFKYDPQTQYGFREPIEQRDPKEVWPDAPKKVKVVNPAFDVTPAKYINAYITEVGIFPPQRFEEAYERAKNVVFLK